MKHSVDTCVVGSGFGGLLIAAKLEVASAEYVVLDKGRTPGGRAATRRFAESRFDHGLPWLTDKGPLTRGLIQNGIKAGVLKELAGVDDSEPAWYCPAGISSLGKHLASKLNVLNRVRVTGIHREEDCLCLATETDGEATEIRVRRNLFLAMPLPQALELIGPLAVSAPRPGADPFHKSIVAMVQADSESMPAGKNFIVIPDHVKFPDVKPGYSIRLSPEDSDELFDADEELVKAFVAERLKSAVDPERIQIMKWRYANGSGAIREPFFSTSAGPVSVAICGDAFLGGQAEGTEAALMSATAAYEALG